MYSYSLNYLNGCAVNFGLAYMGWLFQIKKSVWLPFIFILQKFILYREVYVRRKIIILPFLLGSNRYGHKYLDKYVGENNNTNPIEAMSTVVGNYDTNKQ